MNATFLNLILAAIFAFTGILGCSEPSVAPHPPRQVAVIVSPFQNRKKISDENLSWISHQAGSDIHILDGWTGLEIAAFEVPALNYYNERGVARRIGQPMLKWAGWMTNATDEALASSGAINLPLVLTRISENRLSPGQLLILGSPVLRMPANPQFNFGGPPFRYPGLGNLKNPNSPFCSIGKETTLAPSEVFWLFDGVSTSNWPANYEDHLCAFVGKFFASRGASLVAFTPDCDVGLRLANSTNLGPLRLSELPPSSEPAEMIVEAENTARMTTNAATSTIVKSIDQKPVATNQLGGIQATTQIRSVPPTNASTVVYTATRFVPPRIVPVLPNPPAATSPATQVPPPFNQPPSDPPRTNQVVVTPPHLAVTAPAPIYPIQSPPPWVTGPSAGYAAPMPPYVSPNRPTYTLPSSFCIMQRQAYVVRPWVPYATQAPPYGPIFRQPFVVMRPHPVNPGIGMYYGGGAIRCAPVRRASRR